MIKKFRIVVLGICMLFGVVGCGGKGSTSMSYEYSVETGDTIKVTLDTSDKYTMTSDLPFTISRDGETLSQGMFITAESYDDYVAAVSDDENAKVIDSGTKNGNAYIFWCYNQSEYNYVIRITDSNTGVLIGNPISEKSAKECFERIAFNLE